jgi:hypothetical protein
LLVERVKLGSGARRRRGVGRLVWGFGERIQRRGIIRIVRVVGNVRLIRL